MLQLFCEELQTFSPTHPSHGPKALSTAQIIVGLDEVVIFSGMDEGQGSEGGPSGHAELEARDRGDDPSSWNSQSDGLISTWHGGWGTEP